MAYAAVITLKLTLKNILLHPDRYSIPCDKKHIESFHGKLAFLQKFLDEHPSHEIKEQVRELERRIRDAAYEAEDSMDLHLINNVSSSEGKMGPIDIELMMSKFDPIIEDVTQTKELMDEVIKIGKFRNHEDSEPRNALSEDSSQLASSDEMNSVMGFDHHLLQIKDQLTGQSSALAIISIVGMGGIGKTTLATCAHNDPSVVYRFDVRVWVTVSQSYRVRDIMLGMLGSMKILTQEMIAESDDRLGLHLYQHLKGRRYLITIDDIWDTDVWDVLRMKFPNDENGSRIILTTRIADVATYASPSGTLHHISLLSHDQSWKLLCSKVFGDDPCPLSLQESGKMIAEHCRGLPLSLVVIGGLLSKVEKTQAAWRSIARNVSSFVFSSDDHCSDILRLSYNYLPQYLKACFLYMAVFPKSHEIHVSKLTMMWVAEGFLRQCDGQSPEDVAERCVEDLLDRSLILVSKKTFEGKVKAFRIHDLLLEFCIKEAKDEKFLQIKQTRDDLYLRTSSASERRISIHRSEDSTLFQLDSMICASHVRSFVCGSRCYLSSDFSSRLKLLRILDAAKAWIFTFPRQVLELLNLRYLALPYCEDIPASITKLWNLQTLIISGNSWSYRIGVLPVEIWMMVHLRHLRFHRVRWLDPSAPEFNLDKTSIILEDLRTLSGLVDLKFSDELLQRIPNIEKIDVSYDVGFLKKEWTSYYQLQNLGNLHQLKALKIRVISDEQKLMKYYLPSTFEFQLPNSLKTLTLCGVGIPWHNLATMGSLPNLEVLKLKDHACVGAEWEPNEEQFCQLKVLVLDHLGLNQWTADSHHFPSLERLVIRGCDGLWEIPSGMGDSPTLATILLHECKISVRTSAYKILQKQLSDGNDGFRVIDESPKGRLWAPVRAVFGYEHAYVVEKMM